MNTTFRCSGKSGNYPEKGLKYIANFKLGVIVKKKTGSIFYFTRLKV